MARSVRIITNLVLGAVPGEKVIEFIAMTKDGNKQFTGKGRDEKSALDDLKAKLGKAQGIKNLRTGYPKTVEVNW